MKIGYLVNTYPKPSHSFIRREIRALEARGVGVHRFAMRHARNELVDLAAHLAPNNPVVEAPAAAVAAEAEQARSDAISRRRAMRAGLAE